MKFDKVFDMIVVWLNALVDVDTHSIFIRVRTFHGPHRDGKKLAMAAASIGVACFVSFVNVVILFCEETKVPKSFFHQPTVISGWAMIVASRLHSRATSRFGHTV